MRRMQAVLLSILIASSALVIVPGAARVTGAVTLTPEPVLVSGSDNVREGLGVAAGDDGRIYVAWSERVGGSSDVMLSYSSNNGTTFAPPVRVNHNATGTQFHPAVAVGANSTLYIVWEDSSADGGDIVLSRSADGGQTFQEIPVAVSLEGTQSNPSIAVRGDDVAVVWEDYRNDPTIRIWRGNDGTLDRTITGHEGAVLDVEFSPDGTVLASASEDGLVKLWDAGTGNLQRNITNNGKMATAVNWSADGTMLAVAAYDKNVTIYNASDYSVMARLDSVSGIKLDNYPNAVSFSPDGSQIAVAYNGRFDSGTSPSTGVPISDFNVTVWNLTDYSNWTRKEGFPSNGHTAQVMDVAFSHNGSYIASCGLDDRVKIWNASTSASVEDVPLGYDVLSVSWSPDDMYIAAGLGNGSIVLFNTTNITEKHYMKGQHTGPVNSLDWSPVQYIASGASDPVAKIWDQPTMLEAHNLTGHVNSVYAVDWNGAGTRLATAGGVSARYGLGENQVFCAISHDGGQTFQEFRVSDSCYKSRLRPKAAMDQAGNVHVTWYDLRSGGEDVYYANFTGGAGFGRNLAVAAELGVVESIPDIFVEDDGTAHIVWQYDLGASIRYANSTDGFAGSRDMTYLAQLPRIGGSGNGGILWVVSRQRDNASSPTHLLANISYDRGGNFTDQAELNYSAVLPMDHDIFVDGFNQSMYVWMVSNDIYFRSTVLADAYGPHVVASEPADGETGVSIFTSFTITFSEPMDRDSVEAALLWSDGTSSWNVGDCVGNSGVWNAYGDRVTFTPEVPLRYQVSTYTVTIGPGAADLAGNQMGANYTFSFTTTADIDPPIIEHYPSQSTVSYDHAYTVMAIIRDQWGTVESASLHYQGVGDTAASNSVDMIPGEANTYTASIPAQGEIGQMYYYIEAEDAFGNVARLPVNYTNQSQLFNVSVVDGVPPEISHVPQAQADVFMPINIWAVVSDGIAMDRVELNYRPVGSAVFTNVTMQLLSNGTAGTYNYTIPAQSGIGQVHYNITAWDMSGNRNATSFFTIQIVDRTPPAINSVIPQYLKNNTEVLVRANVTDDIGVEGVTLYFKAVGGDKWVARPMINTGGDIYEFTIPAQRRSGIIYYYVNATDTSGNEASTLTEQDQFEVEVVGVAPDYTLYYVLGAILGVLLVVLAYLVYRRFSGPRAQESLPDNDTPQPARDEEEPMMPESQEEKAGRVDEG